MGTRVGPHARTHLSREVFERPPGRRVRRLPEHPDRLPDLAEAQLAVLAPDGGPVVPREPHERALGWFWQSVDGLPRRLAAAVEVAAASGTAPAPVTATGAASPVLREALRVEVGEEAVLLRLLRAEALPEATDLSADVLGLANRTCSPVRLVAGADPRLYGVSVLRVEDHEGRQPPRHRIVHP